MDLQDYLDSLAEKYKDWQVGQAGRNKRVSKKDQRELNHYALKCIGWFRT